MSHVTPRLSVALLSLLAVAAGPATKPATPNAKPDPTMTEYVVAPVHARFRVPKLWLKKDSPAGRADVMFLFDPAPKKKPAAITLQQLIEVYIDKPTAEQKTLDDVVKDVRTVLTKHTPDLKFTKDAAIKFAGHDAWTLQWTEKVQVTSQNPDGTTSKAGSLEFDRIAFLWLDHDTICQIGLHADTKLMPTLIQKAEPVGKSISFDDAEK